MGESFKKLKTKSLISALIISVCAGVAAGLAVTGLVMVCLKLCLASIGAGYYALISLAAAAVTGAAVFFALYTSDKKLAKQLDSEYSLEERVQTMVEYAGQDGEIIEMQRRDTSEKLAFLPRRKNFYLKYIAPVAALLVACAVLATGVVLPADAGSVFDPNNNKYTPTEIQLMALDTLIDDVEKSSLSESLKGQISGALYEFKTALDDVSVYGAKDAFLETVLKVDGAVKEENSYKTVCPELAKYSRTALFAKALNDSVITYQTRNVRISTYAQVENLDVLVADSLSVGIQRQAEALREKLNVEKSSTEASLIGEMNDTVSCFEKAIASCEEYSEDGLYIALKAFSDELKEIAENAQSYTDTYMQNRFDTLTENLVAQSAEALKVQAFNRMAQDFVRNKIADIFTDLKVSLPELDDSLALTFGSDDPSGDGTGGEGSGSDESTDNTGSGGDQEIRFGSDDKIYNPFTGEYVSYLELLDYYQNIVYNKMNGGDVSQELIEFFEDYFSSLTESQSGN